jgi:hypothetical protein
MSTEIGCGHYLGDTSCVWPYRHEGAHQPADVILVDRRLHPLNHRYVARLKGQGPVDHRTDERQLDFATVHQYKGREEIYLGPNFEDDKRGIQIRRVNRPAVRVGDRWVRRCPELEVVAE